MVERAVYSVRVTLFPRDQLDPADANPIWETITGTPPSEDTIDERQPMRRQVGEAFSGLFEVLIRRDRLDITTAAVHTAPLRLSGMPVFEEDPTNEFMRAALNWFVDHSGTTAARAALVTSFLWQTPTEQEARNELSRLVPSLNLGSDDKYSDLRYTINRYRRSESIENVRINKLMTWRIGVTRSFTIEDISESQPHIENVYHTRADLDINSAAFSDRARSFESAELNAIFEEFAAIAAAVGEVGELG